MPLNPNEEWIDDFGENWWQFHQRLGNMALLPSKENLAQELFEQKKEILLKSQYSINRNIENMLKEDIKEVKADIKTLDKRFQNLEKQIVLIKWMLGVVCGYSYFTKYF